MSNQPNEQFINVPVPASRVQEVYALLGQPPAGEAAIGLPHAAEQDDSPIKPWDDESIRRMFRESPDSMKDMLLLLAKHGGEELSTNEIAAELGLSKGAQSVAGMAGALGRRVSNRYQRGLPWTARWRHIDAADPDKGTETLISLPTWIADVINSS